LSIKGGNRMLVKNREIRESCLDRLLSEWYKTRATCKFLTLDTDTMGLMCKASSQGSTNKKYMFSCSMLNCKNCPKELQK